jgi:hypothetical protein
MAATRGSLATELKKINIANDFPQAGKGAILPWVSVKDRDLIKL